MSDFTPASYADEYRAEVQARFDAYPPNLHEAYLRIRCYGAVRSAMQARVLPPNAECEVCGAIGAGAHHDDYHRPLDVRWLCAGCHGQEHSLWRRGVGNRGKAVARARR